MTDQELKEQLQMIQNGIAALNEKIGDVREELHQDMEALGLRVGVLEARIDGFPLRLEAAEQRADQRQGQLEENLMEEFQRVIDTIDAKFTESDQSLAEAIHEVRVYMELAVGKRVSALFDGYELEHARRVALERDTSWLKHQIDDIQARLALLENKETA